jgi:hypothetical protein
MRIVKPDAEVYDIGLNIGDCYRVKDTIEITDAQLEAIYYGYRGYFDAVILTGREPKDFPQFFKQQLISLAGEGCK